MFERLRAFIADLRRPKCYGSDGVNCTCGGCQYDGDCARAHAVSNRNSDGFTSPGNTRFARLHRKGEAEPAQVQVSLDLTTVNAAEHSLDKFIAAESERLRKRLLGERRK